ncbi:MAG: hypothetical protein JWP41_1611, partial [Ramlibacter sp.]|nr:hypothetical protein [Ramlibacter sp.]
MHTAIGSFQNRDGANRAVDRLVQAGIARDDVHIEHREAHADGTSPNSRWDGMEREVAVDEGAVRAFGNFFASLFGHGHLSSHADSYSQHVDRGGYVVIVDAHSGTDATRARSLLAELEANDLNLIDREGQRPLREIVASRSATPIAGTAGTADGGTSTDA